MRDRPELSIVLPTLNEAEGLRSLLPRLRDLFTRLGAVGEILIVDGGSQDATTATAQAACARDLRQQSPGFGAAVREGLVAATAPWILLLDADGSHPPEAVDAMWARRDGFDLIVGSRYARGGSAEMPVLRWILSGALNIISRLVLRLPVRDSSSGFRLYRAVAAQAAAVESTAADFSVQQDLLVRILAGGGRVIEQPIHYSPRLAGASKANAWKLAPAYLRMLLRLRSLRTAHRRHP